MFKNRIFKNSMWIIVCRLAQSVIALVINMLTARYLGPSNYGLISYAASIVAFVVPLMQLGIPNTLVHELVHSPENEGKIVGTSIIMCACSAVCCIVGVFIFTYFVNAGETQTIIVCVLYSLMLIFQSVDLVQYWFQAKLMSKYVSIATLVAYVVVATYKVFLLVTQKSTEWFAISYTIDYILISAILLATYKNMNGKKLRFSFATAKDMLSRSKYYIVSSMMVVIFAQTDRIMLKLMINNSAVGFYTAATTIAGMTSFVFGAIIDSFRPVVFGKQSDKKAFEKYMSMLYAIIIYLSLAQSIVMTVFSKFIVGIIYGAEYNASISALQIVVWYTTFSYLGSVRNVWILAEQQQKYLWILNLAGAVGNVILNAALIPLWGINGAAVASLATQFFTNVIMNQMIPSISPVNRLMIRGLCSVNIKELNNMAKGG